jgi:hypothetical protein
VYALDYAVTHLQPVQFSNYLILVITFEHVCYLQVLVSMQRQRKPWLNVQQAPADGSSSSSKPLTSTKADNGVQSRHDT